MALSSIARQLRALRALAEPSSGATEPERLAALAKYEDLLRKYHLDASELEIREEGTRHVRVEFGLQSNAFLIANGLGSAIGLFTHCKVWVTNRHGAINFLGLASDAEFAEWLVRSLVTHAQGEAMAYSMDLEPGQMFKRDVEMFVAQCAKRMGERLRAMAVNEAMDTRGNALVVVRSGLINEAFAAMGLTLGRGKHIAVGGSEHAARAGFAAGDRASFSRPVGASATLGIGGPSK